MRLWKFFVVGAALVVLALAVVNSAQVGFGQLPRGMVLIPAGSFLMGDSFGEGDLDEWPVHTVEVSAFYMNQYEVTKGLWDDVASWAARNGYDIKPPDGSEIGTATPTSVASATTARPATASTSWAFAS